MPTRRSRVSALPKLGGLRTIISFSGERPTISWEPRLAPEEKAKRVYTIYGRESLTDGGWATPTNVASRFFKVGVEMR